MRTEVLLTVIIGLCPSRTVKTSKGKEPEVQTRRPRIEGLECTTLTAKSGEPVQEHPDL